jgi:four helix bundle protein
MSNENPLKDKSYTFALHTAIFCKGLIEEKKEYVLSRQLMKSGTSVGANVKEGLHAESKPDFIHKLSIALKEAHESHFWLCILRDSGYASKEELEHLFKEVNEVLPLLISIINSTKRNLQSTAR